jgi:hypothetical protein
MLNTTIRARFEALRSLDGTTPISNAYLAIGTPLTQPARIIKISNETDINILITTDDPDLTPGVVRKDMDFIPANGFILYDLGTNRASMGSTLQFAAGTQFYVKRAGAADSTSGFVYLTVIYAGV